MAQKEIGMCDDAGRETQVHLLEDKWGSGAALDHPSDHLPIGRPAYNDGAGPTELEARNRVNEKARCAALVTAPAARMENHQETASRHPFCFQIQIPFCNNAARQSQLAPIGPMARYSLDAFQKSVRLVQAVVA